VADLLDSWPELEETLVAQAPAFRRLRNPVLRRAVARVATLEPAAGCPACGNPHGGATEMRFDTAADYDAWTAGRAAKVEVTNFGDVKGVRLQGPRPLTARGPGAWGRSAAPPTWRSLPRT
jgi:hypothetical protein